MAKKLCNYRLSDESIEMINSVAQERKISQAMAVDLMVREWIEANELKKKFLAMNVDEFSEQIIRKLEESDVLNFRQKK